MAEDAKGSAAAKSRPADHNVRSSRSSIESLPSRSFRASPAPRPSNASPSPSFDGSASGNVDHVYLKNVLLQFLEQKDKKYQMQLMPVLGMLLQFDK